MTNHDPHKNKTETTHFFNSVKTIQINIILQINLIITHKIIIHQMMMNTIIKIIKEFSQTKDLVPIVLINQIFSNHTQMNK